jgi:hypothetical protein
LADVAVFAFCDELEVPAFSELEDEEVGGTEARLSGSEMVIPLLEA